MLHPRRKDFIMNKPRVLFICIHNSARSQMAEAFLNHFAGDRFEAHSAGIEPGALNPLVVEAMREIGIDISRNETRSVLDKLREGAHFNFVVTVCDPEAAERCPVFPGVAQRLHWPFRDPSKIEGTREEKLAKIRAIRDEIAIKVREWAEAPGGR